MNRTLCILLASAAVALTPSVHAIQFQFTFDFTSGPLTGQSSTGLFETTAGFGTKSASNGGLLGFTTTVAGETFDANDDASYPDFPVVVVELNETSVGFIDFISSSGPLGGGLTLSWAPIAGVNAVIYLPANGTVSMGMFRSGPEVVNLPDSGTTGLLLAAATAGVAMARRRAIRR